MKIQLGPYQAFILSIVLLWYSYVLLKWLIMSKIRELVCKTDHMQLQSIDICIICVLKLIKTDFQLFFDRHSEGTNLSRYTIVDHQRQIFISASWASNCYWRLIWNCQVERTLLVHFHYRLKYNWHSIEDNETLENVVIYGSASSCLTRYKVCVFDLVQLEDDKSVWELLI